jgi:hypothetical protein
MTEPGFETGIWIVLENFLGCELSREFVTSEDDLNVALTRFLKDVWLASGDTIRFVSGESETGV